MGITTPQSLPIGNANYHKFQDQNIELKQGVGMKFTYGNGDRPLGGYTIKRGVGVGGFGEVYFALNDAGKEVAIKRIQRNLDIEIRGVRQCLNLKHPNLISLYDIRQDEQGESWIVMEFVAGKSLRDAIDHVPSGLTGDSLLRWFGQIAAGVAHLHDNGIVHRDLKPANIFEDNGIVKIGDYGLSKFISCSRRGGQTESVGTFHYMAPEIGKGEYGKEIDIYALGIILYEMLTGTVPFEGETSQEIILKHLTADPDLRLLAPPFAQVVGKALQKNPAARFRDIREMIEPLGLAIDTSGMVTQRSVLVNSDGSSAANVSGSPLATAPEMIFGKVQQKKGGGNMDPTAYQPRYAAVRPTELRYEEPIAKMLRESGGKLNVWLNSLPNNGAKAAVIVAGIILLVTQGGFLVPLIMVAACLYIPYYFVWWLMRPTLPPQRTDQYNANMQRPVTNPVVRPQPPVLRPVVNSLADVEPRPLDIRQGDNRLAATPPRPKLTAKQIRSAQRRQLALDSKTTKIQHLTGSWLGATLVVAVLMTLCALGGVSIGKDSQSHFVALVWSSLAAVTGAWTILGFSKSWESKEGDGASRRFMQLTVGLAIGAVAYLLSQFLMIPWNQVANEDFQGVVIDKWSGFYRGDGVPMLPAFLAHFALLFGLVRWWRQADPLRWTRLNVFTLGGSLLAEMIVNAIVPMPQPWGLLVAGGMSAAIQLSSPWRDPSDSPILAEQAPHQMV